MSQLEAKVVNGVIQFSSGKVLEVGSPEWFEWLEKPGTQSFAFCDGQENITIRKEMVKGWNYWYAYKRDGRKTVKRYVGKTNRVTQLKLLTVEKSFNQLPKSRKQTKQQLGNNSSVSKIEKNQTDAANAIHTSVPSPRIVAKVRNLEKENEELKSRLETVNQWREEWLSKCEGKESQPRWQNLYKALQQM